MIQLSPNLYKTLIVWVICLLPVFKLQAQFHTEKRFEIPISKKIIQEDFQVISLKKNGVLFLARREKWHKPKMSWEMIRLDTTFKEVWKKEQKVDKLFDLTNSYYDGQQHLFFLMTRYEKKAFTVIRVNIKDGKVDEYEGKLPLKAKITKMRIAGDYVFFTGSFQSFITALRYNMLDGSTKVVPSVYSKTYNRLEVYSRSPINTGFFLMANSRKCKFKMHAFSNIVGLQPGKEFTFSGKKNLRSATLYPLSATESLILGTYSKKCQAYAQGLVTIKVKSGKSSTPRLYKFIDFKNYFNFYSPKRVKRIRKQILKKAAKGKEYTLTSRMALSEVLEAENNDDLLLIAERYWFRNKAVPPSVIQRGRLPIVDTRGEFQFNSASISAISKDGKKRWDNTIKMKGGVTSLGFEPKVRVGFKGDSIILAYMRQRREGVTPELWSKLIYQHKTLKKETKDEVVNTNENDRIYSSTNQNFIHWYGDVFLLWGEQTVVNRHALDFKARREVAFINKLRYDRTKLTKEEKKKQAKKNARRKK